MRSRISFGLVFAAAVLGGLNSLDNGFLFDDRQAIVENVKVSRRQWGLIWTKPSWFAERTDQGWRPATTSSFAVDWAVHGPAPFAWRLENLLLHGVAAALVVELCLALGCLPFAALLAGLLFGLHPIHTEVLNPIVGRGDILATLCVLGACRLYLAGLWTWALAVFASGLFMKESVISLLPLLPLMDLWKEREIARLPSRFGRWLAFAGVLAAYLVVRHGVTGEWLPGAGTTAVMDNPLVAAAFPARISNALYVLWRYVLLLVVPWPLSADYSFDSIPVLGALSPRNLLAVFLLAGLGWLVWLWRRATPQAGFFLAFFLLTFLLVSNLPFPIGVMMAERFMYLPSVGFCGLAALALSTMLSGFPLRLAAGMLLAAYAWLGFERNRDWRNDAAIFLKTVETSPRSVRAMVNAGQIMLDAGRFEEARALNLAALKEPQAAIFPLPYSNLGIAELRLGDLDAAEAAFREALKRDPRYLDAWVNIGIVFAKQRRLDGAIEAFEQAAGLVPDASQEPHLPKLYYNLALAQKQKAEVLRSEGDLGGARALFGRALANYGKALELNPGYDEAARGSAALRAQLSSRIAR